MFNSWDSRQRLEEIRGKYIKQNRSLAQQNSFLTMKCNSLEQKISELLKENTAMKTQTAVAATRRRDEMVQLETLVDAKFREILDFVQDLKHRDEVPTAKKSVSKKVAEVNANVITEEEEAEPEAESGDEQVQNQTPALKQGQKAAAVAEVRRPDPQRTNNSAVLAAVLADDTSAGGEQNKSKPAPSELRMSSSRRRSGLFADLEAKAAVEATGAAETAVPVALAKTVGETEVTTEKKAEAKSSPHPDEPSSTELIDRPKSKRRRRSDVSYKLPSLRSKMRRSSERFVDAVYDSDELITVDKRKDSVDDWTVKPDIENPFEEKSRAQVPVADMNVGQKAQKKTPLGDVTSKQNVQRAAGNVSDSPATTTQPKRTPLGDTTHKQNIQHSSSPQKQQRQPPPTTLSVFDFIEDDSNIERKTIFRRRNSIL